MLPGTGYLQFLHYTKVTLYNDTIEIRIEYFMDNTVCS